MRRSFRQAVASEIDPAHKAYLGVYEWLNKKGVRQWLMSLSRETFAGRQQRGEIFIHREDDQLAAVVTVAYEHSPYWTEILGEEKRWWVKTLAVVRSRSGPAVGERVMRACEGWVHDRGAADVFVDCVDAGFLPGYYSRLGYQELGRKNIAYPSGYTFPMVLLRSCARGGGSRKFGIGG